MVDLENTSEPYLIGRFFALAEEIEERYIKRYGGSPTLWKHANGVAQQPQIHFVAVVEESIKHYRALTQKEVERYECEKAKILSNVRSISPFYTPIQFGEFFVGYYQQKAYLSQMSHSPNEDNL